MILKHSSFFLLISCFLFASCRSENDQRKNEAEGEQMEYHSDGSVKKYTMLKDGVKVYIEEFDEDGRCIGVQRTVDIFFKDDNLEIGDTLYTKIKVFGPLDSVLAVCAGLDEKPIVAVSDLTPVPFHNGYGYFKTIFKDSSKVYLNVQVITRKKPSFVTLYYEKIPASPSLLE